MMLRSGLLLLLNRSTPAARSGRRRVGQHVPLSRLQQATGLSLLCVSVIRRGEWTPHPQHWRAFRETLVR